MDSIITFIEHLHDYDGANAKFSLSYENTGWYATIHENGRVLLDAEGDRYLNVVRDTPEEAIEALNILCSIGFN